MAADNGGVVKIKGSEPERFMIVGVDWGHRQGEPFMRTSLEMSEEELRKELESQDVSRVAIDDLIKRARENPT